MSVIDGILNSIKSIWAFIQSIPSAFSSVYNWVTGLWDQLWSEITSIISWINAQIQADLNYAYMLYQVISNYISSLVSQIYQWVAQELVNLEDDIIGFYNQLLQYVSDVANVWELALNAIYNWVIQNIWDPIWSSLTYVLNWVGTYGAFIVSMLTDPSLLASFLGKYILGAWQVLGARFAVPFFRWFYSTAISLAPEFSSLLEDVISSLFD